MVRKKSVSCAFSISSPISLTSFILAAAFGNIKTRALRTRTASSGLPSHWSSEMSISIAKTSPSILSRFSRTFSTISFGLEILMSALPLPKVPRAVFVARLIATLVPERPAQFTYVAPDLL